MEAHRVVRDAPARGLVAFFAERPLPPTAVPTVVSSSTRHDQTSSLMSDTHRKNLAEKRNMSSANFVKSYSANHSYTTVNTSTNTAARVLAAHVLFAFARRSLRHVGLLAPSLSAARTFDALSARMQTRPVIHAARLVLRAISLHPGYVHDDKTEQVSRTHPRIFLTAMLFALHPQAIHPRRTTTNSSSSDNVSQHQYADSITTAYAQHAVHTARALILALHTADVTALTQLWPQWCTAFARWERHDLDELVATLVDKAVRLDGASRAHSTRTNSGQLEVIRDMLQASSSQTVQSAVREEDGNALRDIREAIQRLAGERGIHLLDATLTVARERPYHALIHELLLDPAAALRKTRESMLRAARPPDGSWEILLSELSAEPARREMLAERIGAVATMLDGMRSGCFRMQWGEAVALDTGFAVQVVRAACGGLRMCQAEVMDEALEEWAKEVENRLVGAAHGRPLVIETVNVLKELTEVVSGVQADVAVFRMRQIVPLVEQYGAVWERQNLDRMMEGMSRVSGGGDARFVRTLSTLGEMGRRRTDGDDALPVVEASGEGGAGALRRIVCELLGVVVTRMAICTQRNVEEILWMDVERVRELQNDVQRCSVVACVDHVARSLLRARGVTVTNGEQVALLQATDQEDVSLRGLQNSTLAWVGERLAANGDGLSKEDEAFLRNMVSKVTRPDDRVFVMMHQRVLRAVVRGCVRLSAGETHDGDVEIGLVSVSKLVDQVALRMSVLAKHVLMVHGDSIQVLLREI